MLARRSLSTGIDRFRTSRGAPSPLRCRGQPCDRARLYAAPLIEATLLDGDLFSDNEPVSCHFAQLGQQLDHVLIGIHEANNHGKLSASLHQVRGAHFAPTQKSGHRMQGHGSCHVLITQVFEYLQMQWTAEP